MPSITSESPTPSDAATAGGAVPGTHPRRAWRHAVPRRAATWVGSLLLGLAALLALAWLVVDAAIVPRIDQWRAEVERHATQALGVKVRIARLSAERAGLLPRVALHEVRLLDAQDRTALSLGRIQAELSPVDLLQAVLWQELPAARWDIRASTLQVRRDRQGLWHVGGLVIRPQRAAGDGRALDALLSQQALTLHGGRVDWIDELREAPPLALQAVELTLRNRGGVFSRFHDLRLGATPPADWGGPLQLSARFTQPRVAVWTAERPGPQGQRAGIGRTRPADLRSWSGRLAVELPRADVAVLRRHLPWPDAVRDGRGRVAAELRLRRGELAGVTLELAVQQLDLLLRPDLQPLRLARLNGRIRLQLDDDEGRLQAERLDFATDTGQAWPASRLDLSWRSPRQAPAAGSAASWAPGLRWDANRGGRLQADRLDLALLAHLAGRLPLPRPVQSELDSFAPRGVVQDLDLRWDGPPEAPARYSARGRVSGLSLAAREALPPAGAGVPPDVDRGGDRGGDHGGDHVGPQGGDHGGLQGARVSAVTPAGSVAAGAASRSADPALPAAGEPVQAHPPLGRPGLEAADIRFDATEKGGSAVVAVRDGALTFPGVFEEPRIPLRELSARVAWTLQHRAGQAPAVEVRVRQGRIANDDLQGELEATWRTGDPAHRQHGRGAWLPGHLDLDGRLSQARAAAVARYLPQTLAETARHYVRDAVRSGRLEDVRFAVHGDLWDVPFAHGGGQFLIRGQVREAQLAYVPDAGVGTTAPGGAPASGSGSGSGSGSAAGSGAAAAGHAASALLGWPVFTDLHGELVFEQQSMAIRQARARLGTVGAGRFELTGVEGRIADLAHGSLVIDGRGRGPLDDLLQYVRRTPLAEWTGHALADARGSGPADLTLSLKLPLAHIRDASVRGTVRLAGNELQLLPGLPPLTALRGDIDFTERGVQLRTTGRALGGELRVDGGSQADGSLRFVAQGGLTADGLRRALGAAGPDAAGAAWAARLSGQTTARLQLAFVRGQPEWQLTSSLVGLGVSLPAPLGKRPEQAWPLRVQWGPVASAASASAAGANAGPSTGTSAGTSAGTWSGAASSGASGTAPADAEALRIDLGDIAHAHYLVQRTAGGPLRVLRGGIGLLQPAQLPASGVTAEAQLARLDVDAWIAAWRAGTASDPRGDAPLSAPSAQAAAAPAAGTSPTSSSSPSSRRPPGADADAGGGSPGAYLDPAPAPGARPSADVSPAPSTAPAVRVALPRLTAEPGARLLAVDGREARTTPAAAGREARTTPAAAGRDAHTPAAVAARSTPAPAPAERRPPARDAGAELPAALAPFLPQRLQLRAAQLDLAGRSLRDVTLALTRTSASASAAGSWRAQVEADRIQGTVDVADDGSRITARLARLSIPAEDDRGAAGAHADDDLLPDHPSSVPALDIVAEAFEWRGLKLGRLEVQAENRPGPNPGAGAQRLWQLTRLQLTNPQARLNATGSWQPARGEAPRITRLDFTLDLSDSGALLTRLGWPQTLRGGKGRMVGQLSWPGSPMTPGTEGLDGELHLDLQAGQFLKAEPGAARLLGVLSLQSLPRRLLLDFRDVFQQGFAFDRIDGDVVLDNGVARTRNLRMKGLQAVVLMEGRADLNRETQDLNVWVVPEINAGAASLAYAAVNPAIGLGTFVAQYLLRKPLMEANTREFRVTGTWADPQVERVARGQLQPGAAADGPAAAPSPEPAGRRAEAAAGAASLPR